MALFGRRSFDQRGQMSIFIALIFQVLFVLFAMVVNIGLIVYDKINFQNAIDLGAYYAAERQAETLNQIAAINYQIRQDYKLLAWRYYVLGTVGGNGEKNSKGVFPPSHPPVGNGPYKPPDETPYFVGFDVPSMCMVNELWSDAQQGAGAAGENSCDYPQNTPPVLITVPLNLAPWVPFNDIAVAISARALEKQKSLCKDMAAKDWYFAAQSLYLYKTSVAAKKQMILELRKRLVAPADQQQDQNMQSLRLGVIKTIKKNLTSTNSAGFKDEDIQILNGLSEGPCAAVDGQLTMPEVRILPLLYYTYGDNSCAIHRAPIFELPPEIDTIDPSGLYRSQIVVEPSGKDYGARLMHSSLGFEKNPWCMAYVGVKGQIAVKKPFMPFGGTVAMVATAFAQPFGGRIGPWYHTIWPRTSPVSSGTDRTDPLTAPREYPDGAADEKGAIFPSTSPFWMTPNYSRFPADTLGLNSRLALSAQQNLFTNILAGFDRLNRLKLQYMNGGNNNIETGDSLFWDNQSSGVNPVVEFMRNAETSAVAPDVFDATYYSVEATYFQNYLRLNALQFPSPQKILGHIPAAPPDIGGRIGEKTLANFQIEDQIALVNDKNKITPPVDVFYWIKDVKHLLTAWAPAGVQNFAFPEDRFAQCAALLTKDLPPVPGNCAQGGRTGYSVRLLAHSMLLASTAWKVGGDGQEGPLVNPLPAGW